MIATTYHNNESLVNVIQVTANIISNTTQYEDKCRPITKKGSE